MAARTDKQAATYSDKLASSKCVCCPLDALVLSLGVKICFDYRLTTVMQPFTKQHMHVQDVGGRPCHSWNASATSAIVLPRGL